MKLYRIEGPDGVGPWKGGLARLHREVARGEIERDPLLYQRSRSNTFLDNQRGMSWGDHITPHHIFGCETKADLRLWYPSRRGCAAMAAAGAVLATYRASELHTIDSAWEVAFDRRHAKRIKVQSLRVLHR